ncbi:MAG: Hpt domain-containing protein, partial [Candidatus Acidiferrum sp.]
DVILPEIDGVDLAAGLHRVNGNKQLYRDLLMQFAARQSGVESQIIAALHDGEDALLEQIAHTVKGVAGNIGVTNVFTVATKLERAAREKDPAVPALVEEFTLVLCRQIHAIRWAFRDVAPERQEQVKGAPDPRAISVAIAQLRACLESCDVEALEAFVALERALGGNCDRLRLNALRAFVDEFDFEAALSRLDEIAKEYPANQEQSQ